MGIKSESVKSGLKSLLVLLLIVQWRYFCFSSPSFSFCLHKRAVIVFR